MPQHRSLLPLLAVAAGIGTFSLMDALMKGASLAVGAYSAMLWRSAVGVVLVLPVWWARGHRFPPPRRLGLYAVRGLTTALFATAFFWALTRMPLAQGIALSFIAPLIALYLAALFLGERIAPGALAGSLLGLVGVGVIAAGSLGGGHSGDSMGIYAVLFSALLYAVNLVLQRQISQIAPPLEVTLFQTTAVTLMLALVSPWFAVWPMAAAWPGIGAAAGLAMVSLVLISWGYARAQTQVLLPLEYTAFGWAALFGRLFFGEAVGMATLAGAALIVAGCWIAARTGPDRAEAAPSPP